MILLLTVFIRVSFKYAVDASFMLFHSRLSFSSAWLYGSVLLLLLLFRCFSPCLFFLPFTLNFFAHSFPCRLLLCSVCSFNLVNWKCKKDKTTTRIEWVSGRYVMLCLYSVYSAHSFQYMILGTQIHTNVFVSHTHTLSLHNRKFNGLLL